MDDVVGAICIYIFIKGVLINFFILFCYYYFFFRRIYECWDTIYFDYLKEQLRLTEAGK